LFAHRAGLLEDDIRDLRVDLAGRVWALAKQTIVIVEPAVTH
jgi:hypothetical protein